MVVVTIAAIAFGVVRIFWEPLYEFAFNGSWFGLPYYVLGHSRETVAPVFLGLLAGSLVFFVMMVWQLIKQPRRPYSAFIYLAYSVSWWTWLSLIPSGSPFVPPSILVFLSINILCLIEVAVSHTWRQHWGTIAFATAHTLLVWFAFLFGTALAAR